MPLLTPLSNRSLEIDTIIYTRYEQGVALWFLIKAFILELIVKWVAVMWVAKQ